MKCVIDVKKAIIEKGVSMLESRYSPRQGYNTLFISSEQSFPKNISSETFAYGLANAGNNAFKNEIAKVIPTMNGYNIVIEPSENLVNVYYDEYLKAFKESSSSNIKPGVPELFESNPELADAVYQILGFSSKELISSKNVVKSKLASFYKENLFTTIRGERYEIDFTQRLNAAKSEQEAFLNGLQKYLSNTGVEVIDNTIAFLNKEVRELNSLRDDKQKQFESIFTNAGFDYQTYYKELEDRLYGNKKNKEDYKTLTGFDNYLKNNPKEKELFKKLDRERTELLGNYGKLNSKKAAGELIMRALEGVEEYIGGFKESDLNFGLPTDQITPQQKQQAQQLYSQYLDTIFPDSKEKDIFYHGLPFIENKDDFFRDSEDDGSAGRDNEVNIRLWNYFFKNRDRARDYGDQQYAVILNFSADFDSKELAHKASPTFLTNDSAIVIAQGGDEYAVKSKKQIHILGSKQDIDAFENYVKNTTLLTKQLHTDLSNLNFTPDVIKYLHKENKSRMSLENYANAVKGFALNMQGLDYTNEEILEAIKCL